MPEGTPPRPPEGEPSPAAAPEIIASTAPVPAPQVSADPAHAPATVAPQPTKARRKRRRWPFVLLVLFLLIALLVVFAPTIASTGPARSFIVGQVNKGLTGKLQVDDWSLGWASGARLNGVKLFDRNGSQILEVPRITTELRLLDAARGKMHFGKVTVEGLNALIRRDAAGNINFTELTKPSDAPADTGPSKLPDVSGDLHLVNCRATYEDQLQGQTFYFPSIAGQVKCPDINGAIDNALDVTVRAGSTGAPGKLAVAGRLDVVEGNEVRIDRAVVEEKVTVQGVDLGSLAFLFGKDAPVQKLAGVTDAAVTINFKGGEAGTVEAVVNST
ncbi:MAG TPA: hypothetical protein VFB66_05005, partial [Tepidisphaeraceae bacterium]|nr:hypothetical protein [Tepidisphaeraceae bacterium]